MYLSDNFTKTSHYLILITLMLFTTLILACHPHIPPHSSDMYNDITTQQEVLPQDLSNQNSRYDIDELKKILSQYRIAFGKAKLEFYESSHLDIDFGKIDPEFNTLYVRDNIYAGLGYDIDTVNKMVEVIKRVYDPKYYTPESGKIIHDIFDGLYRIMAMYEFILYVCLNAHNLDNNDAAKNPTIVDATYKDFMNMGKDIQLMLVTIQMQVSIALSEKDYNNMCNTLHALVTNDGIIPSTLEFVDKYGNEIEKWWGWSSQDNTITYETY